MTPVAPEPEVFRAQAVEQLRLQGGRRRPPVFDDRRARRAFWPVAAIPLVALAAAYGVRVDEKDRAGQVVRSERLLTLLVRPLLGGDEP
jgi:hypothetical protein